MKVSTWRKSTYSGDTEGSDCVEVAFGAEVEVRDSKNTPGPQLAFSADTWRRFLPTGGRAR